jgi:hypothetical protein
VIGLTMRAENAQQAFHALRWLLDVASPEWIQLFWVDMAGRLRTRSQLGEFVKLAEKDLRTQEFLKDFKAIIGH